MLHCRDTIMESTLNAVVPSYLPPLGGKGITWGRNFLPKKLFLYYFKEEARNETKKFEFPIRLENGAIWAKFGFSSIP